MAGVLDNLMVEKKAVLKVAKMASRSVDEKVVMLVVTTVARWAVLLVAKMVEMKVPL